ncbi:MAG: polyprenol phosphomannose-dependent alpha 1,6 mannosyltransferase MptB [Actinomycetota bacterium]
MAIESEVEASDALDEVGPDGRPAALRSVAAMGFVATALVVVGGSLAGAASPGDAWRLWSVPAIPVTPSVDVVPALIAYYGGLIILVRAWLLLRRHHLTGGPLPVGAVVAVVVIWALPLLVGPPLGSRDVYAYAAQGRMAEQGLDVYAEGPEELGADDPLLAPVDPLYRDTPSPYGPVFVSLSSQVSALAGDRVIAAVFGFRLLAVLGVAVAGAAVFDLARGSGRDPVDALILAVANPLVLFHLVSGAHNEAIMLAFLVSGVALARRPRYLHLGIALCAFAAAIKLPAILAVAFLGWPWALEARGLGRRVGRLALVGAEALAVIAAAGRLTGWGWGWVDALTTAEPVDAYLSVTRLVGGGVSLATGMDVDLVLGGARLAGMALAVGISGLLLLRRRGSWPTALAWSLLLFAVLHPTTQPWYLTWGIMLLAATTAGERNRTLVATCAAAVFVVLPIGPQMGLVVLDNTGRLTLTLAAVLLLFLTVSPAAPTVRRPRREPESGLVSVVVPTRHEADNVEPLVEGLRRMAASSLRHGGRVGHRRLEVLFVDDSDDDTPNVIETLIERAASPALPARPGAPTVSGADEGVDVTVRLLHRAPADRWGGLGGAVADGLAVARGDIAVVMDGDLQHPPDTIPDLAAAITGGADIVAASRRVPGGSDGEGLTVGRRILSVVATSTARWLFPSSIGRLADPLSGFFAVRTSAVDVDRLNPDGFKILVELVATHPDLATREVPYRFVGRLQGLSKASASEGLRYLGHLADLRIRTSRLWAGARVSQRAFPSSVRRA